MPAKDKLLERLNTLEETITLQALINEQAANIQHNKAATFLRKGIGIVAFNILEDYIKERTVEMFSFIPSSLVNFDNLPNELQEAATIGALKALVGKVANEKKSGGNWLSLIQTEAFNINSTSLVNGFTISNYSLMSMSSNIHADDISKTLKCLNIDGGWNTLQRISSEIYGGIPSINQSYLNISSRRHQAAHVAHFDYEYGWLQSAISEIRAIASSFDLALSYRCREIKISPSTPIVKSDLSNKLKYRFLIHNQSDGKYKEKINLSSKTIKNWVDYQVALQGVIPKCQSRREFLIVLSSQNRIIDWYC